MTTKQEAQRKIVKAAKGCEAAEKAWREVATAINGSISTNGYGVHHDSFQLRYKLLDAQKHIQEALKALDGIEWPNNADYDLAD